MSNEHQNHALPPEPPIESTLPKKLGQTASPLAKVDLKEMDTQLSSLFNQDHWFLSILEDLGERA